MNPLLRRASSGLVATAALLGLLSPVSAADEGAIVYASFAAGNSEVMSLDVASGHTKRLTDAPGVDVMPDLAPDGRTIVFVSSRAGDRQLWLMRNDGASPRQLTFGAGLASDPAFSPDGSTIAFVSDGSGTSQIHTIRVAGDDERQLTSSAGANGAPAWRPDGQQIAFVSTRETGADGQPSSDVFVMSPDGSGQRNVSAVPGGEGAPAYTRDGASVIVPRDLGGLWQLSLATGLMQPLIPGFIEADPDLSPGGTDIVFAGVGPRPVPPDDDDEAPVVFTPTNWDIYTAPAGGGAAVRLTSDPAREIAPNWGPVPRGVPGDQCTGGPAPGRGGAGAAAVFGALADDLSRLCEGTAQQLAFNDPGVAPADQGQGEQGDDAGLRVLGLRGGWNATGSRHATIRWAGLDRAPTPAERAQLEAGADTRLDDALLRLVPVATAAVALLVNLPDGCTPPASSIFRPAADLTGRMVVSRYLWAGAWAGLRRTWGEFLPGIQGLGCAQQPVIRIVTSEPSGQAITVKQWLDHVDPDRGWSEMLRTDEWPAETSALQRVGSGPDAITGAISETDGSIGFADLADARAGGFMTTPGATDDTYWVPLANESGVLSDPQRSRDGYRDGRLSRRGSNCGAVSFADVPEGDDPGRADWSATSAVRTAAGYPLCHLIYAAVWDDACDIGDDSSRGLASTITIRDLLGFATGSGRAILPAADGAPPPTTIGEAAGASTRRLSWATPGGSCG